MHELWLLPLKALKPRREGMMYISEDRGHCSDLGVEGNCPER